MAAGELVLQNIRRDDYKMAGDSLTAGLLKRAAKVHNEMFTNGLGASVGQPLVGGAGGGRSLGGRSRGRRGACRVCRDASRLGKPRGPRSI